MTEPTPSLDFSRITFPTDHLTVKDIRREWYQAASRPQRNGSLLVGLEDLIETERELAQSAFYSALGAASPLGLPEIGDTDGARSVLAAEYDRRGVASGRHAAEQLVRSIETQAAAQAAAYLGRRP